MHKKLNALFAAMALMMMPGCFFTGSYWTDDFDDDEIRYDYSDPSSREVTFQSIDGELGGHQLALAATQGISYGGTYRAGTTLELETIDDGTWMLFRLDVPVDLYADDVQQAQFYSSVDPVELMGCTGERPYEFDYDGYASDVQVEVTDAGPGTRRVEWTATFDDNGETRQLSGSVVLDLEAGTVDRSPSTGATRPLSWTGVTSDVGDQGEFTIPSVQGQGFTDGYISTMEFETTEYGQWVMFRLSSYETNLYSAQVGDVIEDVSLLGCTGNEPGNFDFDDTTNDVTVEILAGQNEGERIAHVVGTYQTAFDTRSVEGHIVY